MFRKGFLPAVVLLLLALPILAACAPQATAPESANKEIVIGILDDFAGPLASICTEQTAGRQDAIRYINEQKSGISGHPLRAMVIDHKMDSTLIISGWDRIKAAGVPVDISTSAAAVTLLQTSCQKDHLPVVSGGGTMDLFFPKEKSYFFITIPQYYGTFEALGDMIQKDWAKKGEKRAPKVNFDIIAFGSYQKIYTKCSKMVAEKYGFDYNITYTSLAPADVTTQVLQAKDFGCDYLYLMTPETAAIPWLKELNRQNFRPVIFGSTSLAATEVWGAVGKLCVGTTAYQQGPQYTDTDIPMVKLAHELNAKWHPEVTSHSGHYIRGFSDVTVIAEALKRAVEKVGFDQLNGDTTQAAMETINNFDPGNNVAYTWTVNDHQGVHGCWWYTWTDQGTLTRASDWYNFAPLSDEQKTDAYWLKQ